MGIYLNETDIHELIKHRDKINKERSEAYKKYKIDILSNDILSSLSMWEIIKEYDSKYKPNFHRNGEDGKSGKVLIERKCATKAPNKSGTIANSGWQFHAQETQKCSRYIFAVRNKDDLEIVRIYDINSDNAIATVRDCLEAGKQKWIEKGKPNHDAITVPEKLLLNLPVTKKFTINKCVVTKL